MRKSSTGSLSKPKRGPRRILGLHGRPALWRGGPLDRSSRDHPLGVLPSSASAPIKERVVVDGDWVFAAGVTAGIDGALQLTANLRGEDVARGIQLYMAYAPEPPFNSGTPEGAPAAVLDKARASLVQLTKRREQTARKIAERLGVTATPLDPF